MLTRILKYFHQPEVQANSNTSSSYFKLYQDGIGIANTSLRLSNISNNLKKDATITFALWLSAISILNNAMANNSSDTPDELSPINNSSAFSSNVPTVKNSDSKNDTLIFVMVVVLVGFIAGTGLAQGLAHCHCSCPKKDALPEDNNNQQNDIEEVAIESENDTNSTEMQQLDSTPTASF